MIDSDAKTTFVGIGSSHGDDQLGWHVIDLLGKKLASDFAEFHKAKSPADLLDWLPGCGRLIICDACRGLGIAGQIHRLCWPSVELIAVETSGTHNLNLGAVLSLGEKLEQLPGQVDLWVIEGRNRGAHQPMSKEVQHGIPQLVNEIIQSLDLPVQR